MDGCGKPVDRRGWCSAHYSRWKRHGDPLLATFIKGDDEARWWSHVEKALTPSELRPDLGPCWLWTGATNTGGYGSFRADGVSGGAHRWGWLRFAGPIPDGLHLDHLCMMRLCVNYERHLEPVTVLENNLRALAARAG